MVRPRSSSRSRESAWVGTVFATVFHFMSEVAGNPPPSSFFLPLLIILTSKATFKFANVYHLILCLLFHKKKEKRFPVTLPWNIDLRVLLWIEISTVITGYRLTNISSNIVIFLILHDVHHIYCMISWMHECLF